MMLNQLAKRLTNFRWQAASESLSLHFDGLCYGVGLKKTGAAGSFNAAKPQQKCVKIGTHPRDDVRGVSSSLDPGTPAAADTSRDTRPPI